MSRSTGMKLQYRYFISLGDFYLGGFLVDTKLMRL